MFMLEKYHQYLEMIYIQEEIQMMLDITTNVIILLRFVSRMLYVSLTFIGNVTLTDV